MTRPRRGGKPRLPTSSSESSSSTRTRRDTHTRGVFKDVWLPQVWNRRPGREGALGNNRQPNTLLAWDYTVHNTDLCKTAMGQSNTTLFLIPGGLTPNIQPCDGLSNKLFKSNMSRLYDDYMATDDVVRNDRVTRTLRRGGCPRSG